MKITKEQENNKAVMLGGSWNAGKLSGSCEPWWKLGDGPVFFVSARSSSSHLRKSYENL